jgi:hypothetical protein
VLNENPTDPRGDSEVLKAQRILQSTSKAYFHLSLTNRFFLYEDDWLAPDTRLVGLSVVRNYSGKGARERRHETPDLGSE